MWPYSILIIAGSFQVPLRRFYGASVARGFGFDLRLRGPALGGWGDPKDG